MLRPRTLPLIFAGAVAVCLISPWRARTQSAGLRRITNTSEEGISINPSISGDGRTIAFETTEDLAGAGGTDHFRAIRANITPDTATFFQMGGTRAVASAISQDGSRVAFASKDDPLGANPDGNSEIFLFDGAKLIQVTNTSPGDVADRVTNGNFQPSITDDGRFIAFSSNRDLAAQNSDGNLEILIYDAIAASFTQLTNSSGIVGFSDAKISGDGGSVAYIRDAGTTPSSKRDLLEQSRVGLGPVTLLASNVESLAMTYGRAISDDGTRVVYSGETATNSTQVFLFDGRGGAAARQITSLGVRATEVPLHPTISGDGLRIAFAARRSVNGTTGNSDGSVELYVFDIPSSQVSRITDVPSGVTADVVSSLNDDGSIVAFNFPRVLSGAVSNSESANNSEIYVTGTPTRPPFGPITVLNGASFGKEPSSTKAVAPDSIAVATGGALANSTQQPQRLPNGTFPTNVGGTTVTVNGHAAQIFFVSPGEVNFLVPPQTEIGTADVVIANSENFSSRGTVPTLRAAPGVFTRSGDGSGPGVILNSDTLQEGPFDPSNGKLRLTIFATGARNASQASVVMGGRVVDAEIVIASPGMPGLDEVHVLVPRDLRGAGTVDLFVQSDTRASNPVAVTFTGDGTRDVLINEALADPPDGVAGDANHDGTRDSSDDEFIELVNTTTHDIDISAYQLLTRSSTTTTDTIRHTFAAGTILPACSAIVVFGGGAFDPANSLFGGSQVVKASSGGLSLINAGGVITLRDPASSIITSLAYGGSTGLNGDANQSLTRSPDKTGNFVLHQAAGGSGGRSYSPGTQVNGAAFPLCNPFVRIDVSPSSAAVEAGAKQQFTAKAINANGDEVPGVIFSWQSDNTSVATIDQSGLATSSTAGSTEIRASARGTQSAPATLTVREVPRVLTRIDVTPQSATIPATGAQQFTATGVDQFGNEIASLTFAWASSNTNAATIDQAGLASGISQGQSTIKATSQNVSGTATLNVTAPTVVVNEVLADPPTGTEGDSNHDGTRDSAQDEFVELVNSTNGDINISGWTIRTHSTTSSTETVRHTFVANTTLPAGEAMVVFGGGTFNPADPLFGCAQVVKASSGGLSLTNTGLTILVRDGSGNLVTQFSYGGTTGLNGGNAQSLTRSPDITGNFVLHTTPAGAGGRKFSPGLKLDGTPFGNCALLTINNVTLNEGDSGTTTFTFTVSLSTLAPPGGVTFDIATQDNTATVGDNDYVARNLTGQTIAAGQQTYSFDVTVNGDLIIEQSEAFFVNISNVSGALVGDSQGVGTILNDDSPVLSLNDVSANEGNAGTTTFTFTVSSTLSAPAGGITFDIATADGTATAAAGDYVPQSLTGQTIPAGQTSYTFDVTANGDTLVEPNETFFVNVTNVSGASLSDGQGVGTIQNDDTPLVDISQLYGGGGNTGATYKNDFIELFNHGNTTVDLAGWSVQYTSAAGTGTWSVTPLCPSGPCLLLPGHYFLVQEAQGAAGTTPLPTPDAIGTIAMTTGAGKVALSASTTPLSGACPSSTSILEVVGYGSSATCFEGTGPTAAPANTTSVFRRSGGCTDTNDNAADSFVSAPFPRNSSSPINNCIAGTPPNLTIDDVTVTEGNTGTVTATFTVSLSTPASSTDVTFDIATQNNTATTANSDYVAKSLTSQVIPAGQQTYAFSVTVNGDAAIEPDETFFVNVTNVSGATLLDGQGVGTIHNDDLPALSINDISANEGNANTTTFSFTVSLSAPAPSAITFDIATQDNTATLADNDYVTHSLTGQTIPAGQQTYGFDVTVNGDLNIELSETFFVNVTNVSGATIVDGQGAGTIQNDDSPVLSINDVSASEGNSGTTTVTFTVTSTLAAPAGGITFDIATQDNTATVANSDYLARSLTSQTIPATQKIYTFDVTVNGDTTVEPNETFFVNLSNPSGATIGDGQGVGTIQNDDTADVVISQVYGGGGNTGAPFTNDFIEVFNRGTNTVDLAGWSVQQASSTGTSWSVTALCSTGPCLLTPGKYFLVKEASSGAIGADLPTADATETSNLSATAAKIALVSNTTALMGSGCPLSASVIDFVGYGTGTDCFEGSNHATAPSAISADFRKSGGCIDTNDNAADFVVSVPGPRNSSSPANDCSIGFRPDATINDVVVTEGDTGTKTVDFTVTLSAPNNSQTVTVDYATSDGTAAAGSDYQASNGTVTFSLGQTSKPVTITIIGDTADEPNETFVVNLSNVTNAAVLDHQGQGTITDDDVPPTLTINDVSQNEGDGGTTTFHFVVSLSAPALTGGATFDIATQDNTATVANSDYVARSLTGQTIPAGQQTHGFDVTVNGDVTIEPNESFFVNVSNIAGATVGDGQGAGTIQNDDSPSLNVNDVLASEGNNGTTLFTFTVTSTLPAPAGGITFNIATADNTATVANNDYVARSLTGQTIPAGQTTYAFDVTLNGDLLVESNESFFVNISSISNATPGDDQGLGTIQNDDTANLVTSQVYGGGGNTSSPLAVYKNDFIEVFNRGTTTVALAGWSVQYSSASGTGNWSVTQLCPVGSCLLSPGKYFLVQEAQGSGSTQDLPTPDATGTIAMATASGKVALVDEATPLNGACPSSTHIADRVGYGGTIATTDFCYEGSAPAPAPGNITADFRKAGGCTDTNDNAADFVVAAPNPRNTVTAANDCNAPPTLTSATITPSSAIIGVGDTQQFTGQALDQFGRPIGGVTLSFASNDTSVATVDSVSSTSGNGSATATVTGRATGSAEIRASATNGSTNVTSSPATITVEPAAGQVLISEFRTRGPGGAADEFIEIYNPTTSNVIIGGLVVRSSNNAGSLANRATITAGTTLGPGCHYLLAPASFSASATVPPDQSFTSGITDDGGIAITRSDLVTVIDAVGMSAGSAYSESTTLAPLAGTTNQSYERKPGGASGNGTDTNNNASDFVLNVNTSNPQNSSSGCLATSTADLSIPKTDSPDPVTVGSDITYTLTVTNNGIGAAQTVVVTDDLPSSLTYVSCNATGGGVCSGTGNNRTINFSLLAVGSSATVTLVATVNGTGGANISNTASVSAATSDPNSGNNSATTATTVSSADLSITKSDSPDPVNAGENITYTLVVTNNSATIPAQSVTVTDQIPANTTFVSVGALPSGWTRADSTAAGQTGTVTYTRPTLAASGTATFTITVKVDSNAANNSTISNTANVTSNTPDGNSANNSQTAATTVRTPADLSLTKTVDNAAPNVGDNVIFTITVSNAGPYAASGVSVKDLLPAGLTYVSDDGGGAYANGTGIWTVGTVNASASATLHITATAGSASTAGVTNTAKITASDQFDPDSTPNNHNAGEDDQSSVLVTARSADLSLSKTVDNSSPIVGQDVTFTVTLNNAGPNTATSVQVKDLLPAGLTFVSSTQTQGSYTSSSGIWIVGSVNASASATLTITATVQSTGTITNTAEVTACDVFDPDSTPNNQNAAEDDQASRIISSLQADLSLVKSVDTATPNVGENVVFTIVVSNAGPSPATNVQAKDKLPAGLTYVSDDGGGAYSSASGIWTVGTVNASASATLHITATATSASINGVTNTAEITASDVPDPDSTPNNHASEDDQSSVTVNAKDADLSITKADSPDPVLAGSNITYTINVTNNGPDTALGLTLTDSVPANATFQSLTPPAGWSCNTPTVGGTGATSCTASSLPASQTDSFTLEVKVNSGVAGSTIISNTASVSSSTTFDPTGGNNSVTQTTTVQASANLSITKSDSPDPVSVGNDITYTITVTNGGPDAATSAAFSDNVLTNTTFRSITTPAGWSCSTVPAVGGTGAIGCTNPSFAGSSIFTLAVRVGAAVADGTSISNTASVSSSTFDPDTGNNSVTQTTTAKAISLVISQVYAGGGNTGAQYLNDFVEVFNRVNAPVDISAWSIQTATATGTTWTVVRLCPVSQTCTIPAKGYYLVKLGSGGAVGVALPTEDATGSTNLAVTGGKVALVNNTTALSGSAAGTTPLGGATCPNANTTAVADFIGYGNATCFEGTTAAPAQSNTTADLRLGNGCTDTNSNSADFATGAPNPRNSSSTNTCP